MKKLILLILAITVLTILEPSPVYALNSLQDLIRKEDGGLRQLWEFSRSLINYLMVAFLMMVAFANTLRINIDTYGVKKVLPNLIIAFLLANFSLFLAQIVLDLADSLTCSSYMIASKEACGTQSMSPAASVMVDFARGMGGGSKTAAGIILGVGGVGGLAAGGLAGALISLIPGVNFAAGAAALIGVALACVIIFLLALVPTILMLVLWAMFIIRFYFLQFLIAAAPAAFILMAFPFGKNIFNKWLNQFLTWAFMKPIAFLLMALGSIIIQNPLGDAMGWVVSFFVAGGAIIAAVTVPWKLGSAVNSMISGLLRRAGAFGWNSTRLGLAGVGSKLKDRKDWAGRLGRGMSATAGVMSAPIAIKEVLDKNRHDAELEARAEGASMIGNKTLRRQVDDTRIAEKAKEIEDKSAPELGEMLGEAAKRHDKHLVQAILQKLYKDGNAEFTLYDMVQNKMLDEEGALTDLAKEIGLSTEEITDLKKKGPTGKGLSKLTMSMLGAQFEDVEVTEYKLDKDGKSTQEEVTKTKIKDSGDFVARMRERLEGIALGQNRTHEFGTIERDPKKPGDQFLRSDAEIAKIGATIGKDDPQVMLAKAEGDAWLKHRGEEKGLQDTVLQRIEDGSINLGTFEHIDRLSGKVRGLINSDPKVAAGVQRDLTKKSQEMLAKYNSAMKTGDFGKAKQHYLAYATAEVAKLGLKSDYSREEVNVARKKFIERSDKRFGSLLKETPQSQEPPIPLGGPADPNNMPNP
ncbi:hypothetical protein HYW32_02400 [Candidatus Berkelbacteria bacterium]|nr:hypothetical protein [Candidatus Berkelbacteria bacterium]